MTLWHEGLLLLSLHMAALIAPGPDFFLIIRTATVDGLRAGIIAACGVGLGLTVHIGYAIFGREVLDTLGLIQWLRVAAVCYLSIVGWQLLRSSNTKYHEPSDATHHTHARHSAFLRGFFTNVFNPKATMFFLSVFGGVVSAHTPIAVQLGYGVVLVCVTALWFLFVAALFGRTSIRQRFARKRIVIDRLTGCFFFGIAILLAVRHIG